MSERKVVEQEREASERASERGWVELEDKAVEAADAPSCGRNREAGKAGVTQEAVRGPQREEVAPASPRRRRRRRRDEGRGGAGASPQAGCTSIHRKLGRRQRTAPASCATHASTCPHPPPTFEPAPAAELRRSSSSAPDPHRDKAPPSLAQALPACHDLHRYQPRRRAGAPPSIMVAVLPAQLADLERIAAIHYDAFRPSAISRRIFADVKRDDQCAKTVARLTKRLDDPTSALFKAVVDDLIVGFALWEVPKKAGDPEPDKDDEQKGPDRWPAGTNVALAESFFARLDLGIQTPHYHLSLLATDPARHRSGAGSALLRWGSQKADDEGVECYLEATELAIPVYLRGQYEHFREPIVAEEDPELVLYPMRRPALTLRPVTPDDLPPLAPVHRLAFWPTKVNLYSYSDVTAEAYEAHFINRFGKFIKQRDEDGVRYLISVATRGDKYLGYGFSSFEVDEKERPADSGEKRFWPEGANVRRAEEYLAGTLDKHKKDNLPFAHWSLSILSVHPDCQGQGVGRRLVQEVLDLGKRDGVPVTLESTELGKPLYDKMGFVEFGEILRAKEDPDVELWPMRYDPSHD